MSKKFIPVENSLEDSGWLDDPYTSQPHRGIRDYNRTVMFEHKLSEQELKKVVEWLQVVDCPGWTGVIVPKNAKHEDERVYTFRTTWDSSD